jgi:hypothetical protein
MSHPGPVDPGYLSSTMLARERRRREASWVRPEDDRQLARGSRGHSQPKHLGKALLIREVSSDLKDHVLRFARSVTELPVDDKPRGRMMGGSNVIPGWVSVMVVTLWMIA